MYRNYGQCPDCGEQCWLDADVEPNLLGIRNRHPIDTDYGPGENWIEDWKCPACHSTFIERNGYP